MYDTIDDTITVPLEQDKNSLSHPGRKPLIAARSCTDFNYLDDDASTEKNIAYYASMHETVTNSKLEVNSAYMAFSPGSVFVHHTLLQYGTLNVIQRSQSCPTLFYQ